MCSGQGPSARPAGQYLPCPCQLGDKLAGCRLGWAVHKGSAVRLLALSSLQPRRSTWQTAPPRCTAAAWRRTLRTSCRRPPFRTWPPGGTSCGWAEAGPTAAGLQHLEEQGRAGLHRAGHVWGGAAAAQLGTLQPCRGLPARSGVTRQLCLPSRRHKFYRSLLQCADALCSPQTASLLAWHSAESSRSIASAIAGLETQAGLLGRCLAMRHRGCAAGLGLLHTGLEEPPPDQLHRVAALPAPTLQRTGRVPNQQPVWNRARWSVLKL